MTPHTQPDAAILRQPALGNVKSGHNLDARNDRRLQPQGRRLGLVQHAIITVADPQPVLERLDVDIGSTRFDGAGDQLINQSDHRGLAREVPEALGIRLGWFRLCRLERRADIDFLGRSGIEPIEGGFQLDWNRNSDPHCQPESLGHRCGGEAVQRVGHRQHHHVVALGDRQHLGLAEKFRFEALREQRHRRIISGAQETSARKVCHRLGEASFADHTELRQHAVEASARVGRHAARAIERALVDDAACDEAFAKAQYIERRCIGAGAALNSSRDGVNRHS